MVGTAKSTTNWIAVLVLWGAGLGAAGQYAKVSVVFSELAMLYPQAGSYLGFVLSLLGVVGIFLGVVAGVLVARIGYRRTMLWALIFGAFLSAVQAALPAFSWLLVSRVIEGATHLALVVAAPTLIAHLSAPEHRGFALSLWSTFFGVAFAVMIWLGLPLVGAYGVAGLYLAHAIYMALFALLVWRLVPADPMGETVAISMKETVHTHIHIYRSAALSAPAIGWLFYTTCYVSLLTLLPPMIAPDSRALVMGMMPLVSIVAAMSLGIWLLRYWSARRVVQLGFIVSATLGLGLCFAPGAPVLCLALAGGMGLIQGSSFAIVPQLNPETADQAKANGAIAQMGNLGNFAGTPFFGAVSLAFGFNAMMLVFALILLIGALSYRVLLSRHRLWPQ